MDTRVSLDLLVENPQQIEELDDAQTWAAYDATQKIVPRLWRKLLDVKPRTVSREPELMSLSDICAIVRLHPQTVRRTWKRDKMPLFMHHHKLVCLRGALNEWLQQRNGHLSALAAVLLGSQMYVLRHVMHMHHFLAMHVHHLA